MASGRCRMVSQRTSLDRVSSTRLGSSLVPCKWRTSLALRGLASLHAGALRALPPRRPHWHSRSGVQDGAEPTKSARTLPIFLGGRRLNHSSCRPPLLWLTPLRHRVGSQPPGPVRPRPRPPPLLGPQARRRANADPWSRGAGAESAARKIQGGRAAQEAGAQFAAPTSRWPGRARTRQRSRPARPARAGGAAPPPILRYRTRQEHICRVY